MCAYLYHRRQGACLGEWCSLLDSSSWRQTVVFAMLPAQLLWVFEEGCGAQELVATAGHVESSCAYVSAAP